MQVSAFFLLPCWFCCWPLLGALLDSWLYLDRAYPLCSCPTFNLLLCLHVLYLTVASVFVWMKMIKNEWWDTDHNKLFRVWSFVVVLCCHVTPVVLIGFVRSLSFALFVPFLSSFLSPSGGYTSTKYHPLRSNFLFLSSSFFLRRHSDALFFYLVVIVTSQSLRIWKSPDPLHNDITDPHIMIHAFLFAT